jgi:hypothetical protein
MIDMDNPSTELLSSHRLLMEMQMDMEAPIPALVFGLIGSVLTLVTAGPMFLLILSNKSAMKQVRPRLLAVLAGLDTTWAITAIIHLSLMIQKSVYPMDFKNYPTPAKASLLVFIVGMKTSELWTALIGFHVLYMALRKDVSELTLERTYWGIMILVALPFAIVVGNALYGDFTKA